MTWKDFTVRLVFAIIVIIAVVGTIVWTIDASNDCAAKGGQLVKGVAGYVCVGSR